MADGCGPHAEDRDDVSARSSMVADLDDATEQQHRMIGVTGGSHHDHLAERQLIRVCRARERLSRPARQSSDHERQKERQEQRLSQQHDLQASI